ncbi:MAG TPA: RluA family pseudouridine synthase [Bacilli bacterium]|nr:RluA family pseudouridine synthase [Bacilli bacterium]
MKTIIINNKEQMIKDFFSEYKLAKAKIYKLLITKSVLVNGVVATENTKTYPRNKIEIDFSCLAENPLDLWDYSIEVAYEDEDILLVNKPAGLLVHSDGTGGNTLTGAVNFYLQSNGDFSGASCIHRLDVETSGLVMFAKNPLALAYLSFQMEEMLITKKYLAVIEGVLSPLEGTITLNIGKNRHLANCYIVTPKGKPAVTKYATIQNNNEKSLVEAEIITGRTHQIRVHFSHLQHPIIGDKIYGKPQEKMMLFAQSLQFVHPRTKKEFSFKLSIPKDFIIKTRG